MYYPQKIPSLSHMQTASTLSPSTAKLLQMTNQSTPQMYKYPSPSSLGLQNLNSSSSIDMSSDMSGNTSRHIDFLQNQMTFVDRQLVRNVFDGVKQNQSARVALEKIVEEITELELTSRRLVSENARLVAENSRAKVELSSKDRSLQELSGKLNKVIDRVEREQPADAGFVKELSVLLGEGQQATQGAIKNRIEKMLSENGKLQQQIGYLENLLTGKRTHQEAEMERLIHKASKALVQRDDLQSKVHELQDENTKILQTLRQKQSQLQRLISQQLQKQKQDQISQTTNDTPHLQRRPSQSQSFLISNSQTYQVLMSRFTRIQDINHDLTRRLTEMSIQSQALTTDLYNQLKEIENMMVMSQQRETEFEHQLRIFDEELEEERRRGEKTMGLAGMLETELNKKCIEMQAMVGKMVGLEKENYQLRVRVREEEMASPVRIPDNQPKTNDVQKQISDYQKKIRILENKIEDFEVNSNQNESRHQNMINLKESMISQKDSQITKLTKEIEQLRFAKVSEPTKFESSGSSMVDILQKQNRTLKARLDQYEIGIVPQLFKQIQAAQNRTKDIPFTKKSFSDPSSHQSDRIILNLSREMQKYKTMVSQLTMKKSQLQIQLAQAKKQVSSLRATSPTTSSNNPHQVKELQMMIRQLEKENTELTNKIDNLEYDMVRLREEGKQKGQDKSLTFELSEGSILH